MQFTFTLIFFVCSRLARSAIGEQSGGCPPLPDLQRGVKRDIVSGDHLPDKNGKTISYYKVGAVMNMTCENKFTPLTHPNAYIKCVKKDGYFTWDGEMPMCVENICPWKVNNVWQNVDYVKFIFRSRLLDYNLQESLFPEDTRVYSNWPCPNGTSHIMKEWICLKNATWGGSHPECVNSNSQAQECVELNRLTTQCVNLNSQSLAGEVALAWPLTMTCLFLLSLIVITYLLFRLSRPHHERIIRGFSGMSDSMSRYLSSSVRQSLRIGHPPHRILYASSAASTIDSRYATIDDSRLARCEAGPSGSNCRAEVDDAPPAYAQIASKSERMKQSSMKKSPK